MGEKENRLGIRPRAISSNVMASAGLGDAVGPQAANKNTQSARY
jgi:hypothetical protein